MIVLEGGLSPFAALYGSYDGNSSNRFDSIMEESRKLGGAIHGAYERVKRMTDDAVRSARRALSRITKFDLDNIPDIRETAELFNASPRVARYIVAEPEFRRRVIGGTAGGYSIPRSALAGDYQDDYHYQAVMDGYGLEQGDDMVFTSYHSIPLDIQLDSNEQDNLRKIWALAVKALNEGTDVSSSVIV